MSALSFWERRKAAVAAEEKQALADDALSSAAPVDEVPQTDEEILQALDLPDPDSLKPGDDVRAFMAKAVPAHLRNRALRHLWRSNPVLACLDGLNDYDDDYLAQATGQGPLKTTYAVGKGLLAHVEKMAAAQDAPAAVASDDSDDISDTHESVAADAPAAPQEALQEPQAEMVAQATGADAQDEMPGLHAPRRMQFQFDEAET